MLKLTFACSGAPLPVMGREVNAWLGDDGAVFARAYVGETVHCIQWLGVGVFAYSASSHEVRVWPDGGASRGDITETFHRMLQPIIVQALGEHQVLHAAATEGRGGILAFCGNSGSGKSTLAFAMRQAGLRQVADDSLVLRLDPHRVAACPLPFVPRLRPASRIYFADARVPVPDIASPSRAEAPLAAVFLLRRELGLPSPCASLLPRAQAFSKLLAHAHCFDPEDPEHTRHLATDYLRIVACVPVFSLVYSPDFRRLSQLTSTVLAAAESIETNAASRFSLPGTESGGHVVKPEMFVHAFVGR